MSKYALITTESDLVKDSFELKDFTPNQKQEIKFFDDFESAVKAFTSSAQEMFPDSHRWFETPLCDIADDVFEDEETGMKIQKIDELFSAFFEDQEIINEDIEDMFVLCDDLPDEPWSLDISNNTLLFKEYREEISKFNFLHTNIFNFTDENKEYFITEMNSCNIEEDYFVKNTFKSVKLIPIK